MEPTVEDFIKARSEFCERIARIRMKKFDKVIKGSEFDDQGLPIDEEENGIDTPPMLFHLIYEDSNKNLTGRSFKLLKLKSKDDNKEIIVGGPCFLRNKYRSFYASRMVELTDLSTGEVFDDAVSFFSSHPLLGIDKTTPRSAEEQAVLNCRDELVILSLLAAVDGEIHQEEFDIIVKYVFDENLVELDEQLIASRIAAFVPDERAFSIAMARLQRSEKSLRNFKRTMIQLAECDGHLRDSEIRFVQYVSSRIR